MISGFLAIVFGILVIALLIYFTAYVCLIGLVVCLAGCIIQAVRKTGTAWKWGIAAVAFAIVGAASGYFIYSAKKDAPEPTPVVTAAPEGAEEQDSSDEKASATPAPTEPPKRADEWTDDVSYSAELVLSQIAEDIAKQAAQNPDTVKIKASTMVFGNKGDIYTVESDFECSSRVNYTETHTIRVYCEADTDREKIQPYEVYLDGVLVASLES